MRFESDIVKKDKRIATFRSDDFVVEVYLSADNSRTLYFKEKNIECVRMILAGFPEHLKRKIINDDVYKEDLPEIMNELGEYLPSFMKLLNRLKKKG